MALSERLALVIDADPSKATAAFRAVGNAAEKELGKTQSSLDKTASRLKSVGAGMVTFGAVALVGLGKAAMASEEADKAMLRLQNSMANNKALAGVSSKAFTDLATALSKKTAADDDSIISGQAVLAQMGLTADQITELTPLVVDLSRKMGVDMDTAAKTVAKSVAGSAGALKKMGIDVDATAIKTDAFGATVDALNGSVGGFAEAEGKTFSGQLAIMKNQLGELAEGVGAGAVDAFSNMFSAVTSVTGALDKLAPGTQNAIGQVATYGATALVAVGATTSLVGQVLKSRDAFIKAATALKLMKAGTDGGAASLTRLGGVFGIVGIAATAGVIGLTEFTTSLDDVQASADKLAKLSLGDLADAFSELGVRSGEITKIGLAEFESLAEQSIGTAERLRNVLQAQGVDVSELDAALRKEAEGQRRANNDAASAPAILEKSGAAVEDLTDSVIDNTEAAIAARRATHGYGEAMKDAATLTERLRQAQLDLVDATLAGLNATLDYQDAQWQTNDALQDVKDATEAAKDATSEYGKKSAEAAIANQDAAEATNDFYQAALAQADAAAAAAEAQAELSGATFTATDKTNAQIAALQSVANMLAPGSALRAQLDAYIATLAAIPLTITTDVYSVIHAPIGGGLGYAASGGPVKAGKAYMVGEQGPEIAVFGDNGYVLNRTDAMMVAQAKIGTYGSDATSARMGGYGRPSMSATSVGRSVTVDVGGVTVVTPEPAPTVIAREVRKLADIWAS